LYNTKTRLITELSITSATAFISRVLAAEVIKVESGIPILSAKSLFCLA
jgi:hypothetical protein